MSRFGKIRGRFGRDSESHAEGGDGGEVIRTTPMPYMRSLDLRTSEPNGPRLGFSIAPAHLVLAAAIPLAAIVVGLLYISATSKADDAKAERDRVESELEDVRARTLALAARGDLLDAVATAGEGVLTQSVAASLGNRIAWDRLVLETAKVRPEGTWYSGISGASVGVKTGATASEGADRGAGDLRLDGFALDQTRVAKLVTRLDALRDIDAVALESTNTTLIGEREVVQFAIAAQVRGSR